MMGGQAIARADLLRLLESGRSVDQAQLIVERLDALDADELPVKAIPTRELQAIYERRRSRMPDAHPLSAAVDRLLAVLNDYRDAEVIAVTVESLGSVAVVWLAASGESVLSTLVDDRGD